MWRKRSKVIAVLLAAALMVGGVVGGTMAWLSVKTEPVVNTFTYGDINITLDETKRDEAGNTTDADNDENPDKTTTGNEYKMVPGNVIEKDPTVTVLKGSEVCWLFVKVEENCKTTEGSDYQFDDYMTYEVNTKIWTQLKDADRNDVEGVYYMEAESDKDADQRYSVIGYTDKSEKYQENKVKVNENVTKEMLYALTEYPTLTITAYAVQKDHIDSAFAAWEVVNPSAQDGGSAEP